MAEGRFERSGGAMAGRIDALRGPAEHGGQRLRLERVGEGVALRPGRGPAAAPAFLVAPKLGMNAPGAVGRAGQHGSVYNYASCAYNEQNAGRD